MDITISFRHDVGIMILSYLFRPDMVIMDISIICQAGLWLSWIISIIC